MEIRKCFGIILRTCSTFELWVQLIFPLQPATASVYVLTCCVPGRVDFCPGTLGRAYIFLRRSWYTCLRFAPLNKEYPLKRCIRSHPSSHRAHDNSNTFWVSRLTNIVACYQLGGGHHRAFDLTSRSMRMGIYCA